VHILATETYQALSGGASNERGTRWLRFVKEAKPQVLEDAEYLGWVAYAAGKYDEAAEWLKLANPDTPASCWLRSKFERRAGKLAEAEQSMAKAFKSIRNDANYIAWPSATPDQTEQKDPYAGSEENWTFSGAAAGNLGALHLERAEFIDAFDTFLTAGMWDDAAFIAERILTAGELKAYVDKHAPAAAPTPAAQDVDERRDIPGALRYLLGRRLVREDRYDEARQYLKPPYDKVLDDYAKALKDGANTKLPKAKRARAWFHAAWLARFDGMELMGTEGAPDEFSSGGSFPGTDLVGLREGKPGEKNREFDASGNPIVHPVAPQPSKQELNRLKQNRVSPEVRYHYRVIAAALAMRAAALMPDDTEELADVIVQAGRWVGNNDANRKLVDRYYRLLEKRCRSTKEAAASREKGRFVEQSGPWSSEEEAARSARVE
jgi:tetratricopeptide (TPR) repeat protein